ncbi:MAG: acyltransferase [Fibrobacteria bacterium]|nr:acyltransferase [Fibrobacteria bacterium]
MNRILWIDIAKGWAILLVVLGHVLAGLMDASILSQEGASRSIYEAVYLFHMPLFFFLSGLNLSGSLERGWPWKFLESRLRSFLLPCLLWATLQTMVAAVLSGSTNHPVEWTEVFHFFDRPPKQFWFTMAFGTQLLVLWGLFPLMGRKVVVPVVGLGMILWFAPVHTGIVAIDSGLPYWAFLGFGMLLGGRIRPEASARIRWIAPVAMGYAIGVFFLAESDLGALIPIHLAAAFSGIAVVVLLSAGLGRHANSSSRLVRGGVAWAGIAGQASLPIFMVHILVSSGTRIVLARVPALGTISSVHILMATSLGVAIPVLMWRATKSGPWGILWGIPVGKQSDQVKATASQR